MRPVTNFRIHNKLISFKPQKCLRIKNFSSTHVFLTSRSTKKVTLLPKPPKQNMPSLSTTKSLTASLTLSRILAMQVSTFIYFIVYSYIIHSLIHFQFKFKIKKIEYSRSLYVVINIQQNIYISRLSNFCFFLTQELVYTDFPNLTDLSLVFEMILCVYCYQWTRNP